eukprot:TRINITY_DN176_c0_g3_i1.p1 TRINITY_DN176_c0_g3~~TRINITY_DN176_c0_g3_i1.p1  ORF type:complete len:124 (-),score=61.65 TRINITY_DN176_c0_g3_i1:63-434(-)
MRIIAAYLLAVLGGNENPDVATIKKILSSVEVSGDDARIEQLINELKGKKIEEVISEGKNKLASVGSVAAPAGATSSQSTSAAAAPAAAAAKEEPKKKVEEEEEEDAGAGAGMGGLFGDDEDY